MTEKYNVFILGETKLNIKNRNVFKESDLGNINCTLADIFSKASFVIGSISGATHFPSLLFNKPTLFIGEIPLWHLKGIYLLPESSYEDIKIPSKDFWFLISQNSFEKLSKDTFRSIIKKTMKVSNHIIELKGLKTFICESSINDPNPRLKNDKKGNILIDISCNYLIK